MGLTWQKGQETPILHRVFIQHRLEGLDWKIRGHFSYFELRGSTVLFALQDPHRSETLKG